MNKIMETRVLDVPKVYRQIKIIYLLKILLSVILLICLAGSVEISAQGTAPGRKKTTKPKSTTKPPEKKSSNANPQTKTQSRSPKPRSQPRRKSTSSKSSYANLNLVINELNCKVIISNQNGDVIYENSNVTNSTDSLLLIKDLRIGKYNLTVRKPGFIEENREIIISSEKPNLLSVTLNPAIAYLSINSNVEHTKIELKNITTNKTQEFTALSKELYDIKLPLGNYKVTINKEGYISESKNLTVSNYGQKNQMTFTLKPLPINKLLEDAETAFENGNYSTAIENSEKILSLQPQNPDAIFFLGLGYYYQGDSRAGNYLREALKLGKEITLPVRAFNKSGGKLQLILGDLKISNDSVVFYNSVDSKLNFSLFNNREIKSLSQKFDKDNIPYINIEGKGLINNKNKKVKVKIYSRNATISSSRKNIFCPNCETNSCPCRYDVESLYTLLFR